MAEKNIDKRSLTVIALIKYEIVQLNKALNDKKCLNSEVESIELRMAQLLSLLQFISNSGSTTETFKVLCKWINHSKLLTDSVTEFFNSEEFALSISGLDKRNVKELDDIRNKIPEIMEIKINDKELKKQFVGLEKSK